MAWTTPRTWVTGNILTAAQLNTDIRDNENFLYAPPKCVLNNDFDTLPNTTLTAYDFSSEEFDNDSMHSPSTNTTRATVNTAGVYLVINNSEFADNATGRRKATLRLNGSSVFGNTNVAAAPAGDSTMINAVRIRAFVVNDYVEAMGAQTSGGSLSTLGLLSMHWLSN